MDSNFSQKKLQIEMHKQKLMDERSNLSITNILESDRFQDIINHCREFRERIYTPFITLIMFTKQVLCADKSCKKAVVDFVAKQSAASNDDISSINTGPYSKARQRLPEETVHELVKEVGKSVSKHAHIGWKIYGREVKAFDGTTVKMADSEENQKQFPQHSNQKKGSGFPIARLLIIVSLTVGTVIDYAVDAYRGKGTGEQSLLRRIIGSLNKDDIVLGDRYFPSYFLMADLKAINAEGIFRAQSQRSYDFRKGEKLGKNDHIVEWTKPNKPSWMDQKTYDDYPSELKVREFKVYGNIYVTTFFNAKKYHKQELAKIYQLRWHIEININSIKTTMSMDMLTCKTPSMVKKEIGIHLLSYNLIRTIMAEACRKHSSDPRKISFKGSVQLLTSFMPHFIDSNKINNKNMYVKMLKLIVKNKIGNRPGRMEPRVIKQRPKPFKTLKKPRNIEKNRLKKNAEKRALKYAVA